MRWLTGILLLNAVASAQDSQAVNQKWKTIEQAAPPRFGFAAIHIESGKTLAIDGQARYPMGSVYKALIALTVLDLADQGKLRLDQPIELRKEDLNGGYSPLREAFHPGLTLSIEELLRHMVSISDNTACDVLLMRIGGPSEVTRRLRAWGFRNVQVDRTEKQLAADLSNADEAELERYWNDPRDTSTPFEMARIMARIARCDLVKPTSCALLKNWMHNTPTSSKRIKGALPAGVRVEHNTGGMPGVINDAGIITLPGGKGHIAIAAFLKAVKNVDEAEITIAETALAAYNVFLLGNN